VLLGTSVGCDLGNPGEPLGRLQVEVTVVENSCGPDMVGFSGTTEITVDLYERNGLLTWSSPQGSFTAGIAEDGTFSFTSSGRQLLREEEIDPWGFGSRAACIVDFAEEIRGTVVRPVRPDADAGSEGGADGEEAGEAVAASVEATDTLIVAPAAGSDCSDQVGLGTGLFQSLPCRVLLELAGSSTPAP
jgi:hypothetical protein